MGRPKSSCLNIIPCAGATAAAADEDLVFASPESKASSDRRRWSFRKKSGRQRVLSNTVISEPVSVGYSKESPEASIDEFHSPTVLSASEKYPIQELPFPSPTVKLELVDPLNDTNTTATEQNVKDSDAVIIQAAIRGYFARRELVKHKNVVKLQAVVRGHLVRKQAVGTLRCVQAIIKMQTLVRARQTRHYVKELAATDDEKLQMDTERSTPLGTGISSIKLHKTRSSTEKLLCNRFSHQLLESMPKTKHIPIKCDASKSDSVWKWLERWMAVASPDERQQQEYNINEDYQKKEEETKLSAYGAHNDVPLAGVTISSDLKAAICESALPIEGERIAKSYAASEIQSSMTFSDGSVISLTNHDKVQSHKEEALGMATENITYIERVAGKSSDSLSDQIPWQSDVTAEPMHTSISDEVESAGNYPKLSVKASCEPQEIEGNRQVVGSRKARNPVFAAVQSKFEELSSASVGRTVNSAYIGALSESKPDSPIPQLISLTKTKDTNLVENSSCHDPRIQIAASECGTEISISSTLDSPDRSEAEGEEIVLEIGSLGTSRVISDAAVDSSNLLNINVEAKSSVIGSEVLQPQKLVEGIGNLTTLILATDASEVKQKLEEQTTTDIHTPMENSADTKVYRSSPEGTPRSHVTVAELHGTPSSQVSINAKKGKKIGLPIRKQSPDSVGNGSPSTPNDDSGGKSSTGNLPKDSKTGKKRNSFGTAKPNHVVDHEPKISSTLPSYMQATKSARAKTHVVISPKSSVDVHDKDNYQKKRHSLPIANEKQGSSPRMQRSASQAQQIPKANGTHSPNNFAEKRWQR